jgi:hypothetical protein
MYALHTTVNFPPGGHAAAVDMLHHELIPRIKQAPGFVRGLWFADGSSVGHGVVVFETLEQAQQAQQAVTTAVTEGMTIADSGVFEVDAEA